MSLDRLRLPKWQLLAECLQRELTYLPLAASAIGLCLFPDHAATWLAAPALFAAGACHFIYDFLMGREVRDRLARRQLEKAAGERAARLRAMRDELAPQDRSALDTLTTLAEAVERKILENTDALELTGTFSSTYETLVRNLAETGIDALRRKLELDKTVEELHVAGASEEARRIAELRKVLNERIREVRQRLSDALAQLAVMERAGAEQDLSGLTDNLQERLEMAAQLAADAAPILAAREPGGRAAGETAAAPAVPAEAVPPSAEPASPQSTRPARTLEPDGRAGFLELEKPAAPRVRLRGRSRT